jgi:hypothetical protein
MGFPWSSEGSFLAVCNRRLAKWLQLPEVLGGVSGVGPPGAYKSSNV